MRKQDRRSIHYLTSSTLCRSHYGIICGPRGKYLGRSGCISYSSCFSRSSECLDLNASVCHPQNISVVPANSSRQKNSEGKTLRNQRLRYRKTDALHRLPWSHLGNPHLWKSVEVQPPPCKSPVILLLQLLHLTKYLHTLCRANILDHPSVR